MTAAAVLAVTLLVVGGVTGYGLHRAGTVGQPFVEDGRLKVMASFYPMYDFARKVGGDRIQVKDMFRRERSLMTGSRRQRISGILRMQMCLSIMARTWSTGRRMYWILWRIRTWLCLRHRMVWNFWMEDMTMLMVMKEKILMSGLIHACKAGNENIRDALVKADPENGDYYEANYEKYAGEFDELDQEFRDGLKGTKSRDIIVAHEAFGYLCNAYDLKQLAIEGLTPDSEPDPAKMQEVIEYAKNTTSIPYFLRSWQVPRWRRQWRRKWMR